MDRRSMSSLGAALAMTASITLAACGGGDNDATDTSAAAAATAAGTPAATDTAAGSVAATDMMMVTGGDTGVVAVLSTVDRSEVEAGTLARTKAQNAQVKAFARTLIDEHNQSLRRGSQIARRASLPVPAAGTSGSGTSGSPGGATTGTPGTGDTAAAGTAGAMGAGMPGGPALTNLQSTHTQTMTQLRASTGTDFDRAFLDSQAQAHQTTLDLLNRMQTQVQDSALRQHVTEMIPKVQAHLDRTRELQAAVSGSAAGTDTGRTDTARTDTARKGS